MPTIEERALALVNEVKAERSHPPACYSFIDRDSYDFSEAFCRELEAHDAERAAHAQFRQEVSDVARDAVAMLDEMAKPLLMGRNVKERLEKARSGLASLIIAKPDPLVEAVREAMDADNETTVQFTNDLRAALAKRGGSIVFKEVGDAD